MRKTLPLVLTLLSLTGTCGALEKETSLVTGKKMGELAVAGGLLIDVHAEFMMSRTFDKDTVLHWYNCGLSGGGKYNEVGGSFGNFGLDVPYRQRDEKYPRAVRIGDVPAVRFDGGDIMKGNFAVEPAAAGNEDLAIEVWLRDDQPSNGEVVFGWQSDDGSETSGAFTYPADFKGSEKLRHIVANCTGDTEAWYLDGKKVSSGPRKLTITAGHKMVLGGASARTPSFVGSLVAVRLHEAAMTEEEIAHNFQGGVMLGTEMHAWWRVDEPDTWWVKESAHFRHCVAKKEMAEWNEKELSDFHARVPAMFDLAEKLYHLYSERLAMRSSVVSSKPEFRGDGIKYKVPIQPSSGNWMGWSGALGFGWACQGAGHINPHELVHGWQAQTGGAMQGNYWEAHANFPQTYAGIYQTIPGTCVSRVCMFFPAHGRSYYHDRLMFEHLAQSPEYGPMFISKFWYDGGTGNEADQNYPWLTFPLIDPDPSTDLGYEWTRMVQKCITWDYEIFGDQPADLYKREGDWTKPDMTRYAQVLLERIPYDPDWWRAPKEMTPQQLGYSVCPLEIAGGTATADLDGYVSTKRGGDWRAAFVGVKPDGAPVYGDIVKTGGTATMKTAGLAKLYLVVCAVPTKILPINMTGDFRSFEQEKFPYKLKLAGCMPLDVLANERPVSGGKSHSNGGGFVSGTAQVDATAYVGPHAQVLGNSKILGHARIEDHAVVQDATVRDNAIVSGHARVEGGALVQDHAKVRDWGRAIEGATIKDYAKVIEHGTQAKGVCSGHATIKGVAHSSGNVRGTAMIDGSYAKGNEVDKGRWFTWSWGKGKNPGEDDEEFGGIYMRMNFDTAHEWMAPDDFGATWGYLVGNPAFDVRVPGAPESGTNGVLALNGRDQFVELQRDVADMNDLSMKAVVTWQGKGDAAIAEFSNTKGERVFLGAKGGKCVFSISKGGETQSLEGPALKQGVPTEILVVLSADTGTLWIDGREVARNEKMTLNPDDVNATECYLGRGRDGDYFRGEIDLFEVYSVALKDELPPTPNPAKLISEPLFVNPTTAVMQAEVGVDPLGGVEYYFAETSGNPGGDDSGWIKESTYRDSGLEAGREYVYTVKMRDAAGNVGDPSAPAKAKWEGGRAFRSADGKTIVIESENFTRNVPGSGAAKDSKWELTTDKPGCSGMGMMKVLPDRGLQVDTAFESQCPRLDYLVDFPEKGKYTVWMRSWGPNPNSDSVFLGVDMKPTGRPFHSGYGRMGWAQFEVHVDTPGLHTLNLWMREDGCTSDKLILTSDGSMAEPQGMGPAESARQ